MYDSKYTDRKVTAAQYIAEIMCERKSKKEKKKLNPHFWNEKEWGNFFRRQHTLANNLLKLYSEGAIIQGINRKDVKWAYSLNLPAITKAIESFSRVEEQEVIEQTPVEQRKEEKKKSLLDLI